MQLSLPLSPAPPPVARPSPVAAPMEAPSQGTWPRPGLAVPEPGMTFVRRRGARRYILRVLDDGMLRVTVPWWGTQREARQFAETQHAWVAQQRALRAGRIAARWSIGTPVLVDGVAHTVVACGADRVAVGRHVLDDRVTGSDVGPAVRAWLRSRATAQLPVELAALSARHGITVARVAIRDQKSRWGSCSRRGTISLNWRLVQTPPFVREYVLLHELMHRRELNHSRRFWRLVAAACPRMDDAKRWLRTQGTSLF